MTVEAENPSETEEDGRLSIDAEKSVVPDESQKEAESVESEAAEYPASASWWSRLLAYALDVILPLVTLAVIALVVATNSGSLWVRLGSAVAAAAIIGVVVWNVVYWQGKTGRTIGKSTTGIRTVRSGTEGEPGFARVVGREIAHVVDTVPLLIGWLWPLWDSRSRSFADKLADTRVVAEEIEPDHDLRRRAAWWALETLAVFAAALVTLCAVLYFHDHRRDDATSEIADRAQDVAQKSTVALLSYKADTVDQQLDVASSKLTGSFKEYYDSYSKTAVIPTAREKAVNTEAHCVGTGLVSADDRQATVIVFINQTTTTADNPEPAVMASTVRVQLTRAGGDLLVSGFEPI